MSLTPTQVRHIAKLARLTLSDSEVEKFSRELTQILDYIEKLKEVKTEGVEPMSQITGLGNVTRADGIAECPATTEALLAVSPLPIVDQQIETPSALG
ncbi:MAG: Asp-tRNA(Asn)/Glu-tRNA(Gln) amidotransferase subunit GatC [Candidatus Peribacteraceae bacterium]|nr:Asp-tRNA(Asn)/Glu-tRNA(Gln) amidotransferase subunit GatC [Candidatus Peribacteraceae bacterium]MDD5742564.1 Asp-tRNA(Asn)/Glu-tRNA(Gln) amidotransferase subunit GatC [Candidatus Peribacteraceae bacterium]